MIEIPASHVDLVSDNVKSFAFLATVMADGTPQVTPVWFSFRDGYLLINSAEGRTKDRNMRERPNVAVSIPDPGSMYRYVQIRGRIVEITREGAVDHINWLSQKYLGKPYNLPEGQMRVIYRVEPNWVTVNG